MQSSERNFCKTFSWRLLFTCQPRLVSNGLSRPRCGAVSRSFCLRSCCVLTIRANSPKRWRVRYPRYQYNTLSELLGVVPISDGMQLLGVTPPFRWDFSLLFFRNWNINSIKPCSKLKKCYRLFKKKFDNFFFKRQDEKIVPTDFSTTIW